MFGTAELPLSAPDVPEDFEVPHADIETNVASAKTALSTFLAFIIFLLS
jgi:hypothetical protein